MPFFVVGRSRAYPLEKGIVLWLLLLKDSLPLPLVLPLLVSGRLAKNSIERLAEAVLLYGLVSMMILVLRFEKEIGRHFFLQPSSPEALVAFFQHVLGFVYVYSNVYKPLLPKTQAPFVSD